MCIRDSLYDVPGALNGPLGFVEQLAAAGEQHEHMHGDMDTRIAAQRRREVTCVEHCRTGIPVSYTHLVQLALHPDDPPVGNIGGIGRILTSAGAMQKAIDLVPSEYNGITLCQGSFAAMGEDVIDSIRHFGRQKKLFFAHFRDLTGCPGHFQEAFHHAGQTDMLSLIHI